MLMTDAEESNRDFYLNPISKKVFRISKVFINHLCPDDLVYLKSRIL